LKVRLSVKRNESYPQAVEIDHWSQRRSTGAYAAYEVLALAVCEDAYMLATQFENQPKIVQRELTNWFYLKSEDCVQADPRSSFCLDAICFHFGWDLEAIVKSYVDATQRPCIDARRPFARVDL
jgi:hypothetical protein